MILRLLKQKVETEHSKQSQIIRKYQITHLTNKMQMIFSRCVKNWFFWTTLCKKKITSNKNKLIFI